MPQRRPPLPTSGPAWEEARAAGADRLSEALAGTDPASRRDVVSRLGGTRSVADQIGISQRSVQRWAAGQTRDFRRPEVRDALRRGDVRDRMQRRGLIGDGARPTSFQSRGRVRVQGPSGTTAYDYARQIGAQGGIELPPELLDAMADRLGEGDQQGALQELEQFMTSDYAALEPGDYDPIAGTGFFFADFDDVSIYNDQDGTPLF